MSWARTAPRRRSPSSGRTAAPRSSRSFRSARPARGRSTTPSRMGPASQMTREIYQAVVDGILIGGVYALMAVGLTLIFGVLDIINIAQGVLVILGAYLSYGLATRFHIDLFVGLLVTVPVMFVIGV